MPVRIDKEDNLEGNFFILVRGIHNCKSIVIICLHEVIVNTIYKNLAQLSLSEINVLCVTSYWKDYITGKIEEKRFIKRQ